MDIAQQKINFERDGICRVRNVVSKDNIENFKSEILELEKHSKDLDNCHSTYRHIKPFVFSVAKEPKNGWKLLQWYRSKELKEMVDGITGLDLHCMPLAEDERFEINCKVNVYEWWHPSFNKPYAKLGWHYDRADQVKGEVIVIVLTVENNLDDYLGKNSVEFLDSNRPILSYIPKNKVIEERGLYLGGNSITIHDARAVFHRVNEVKIRDSFPISNKPLRRTVFVTKMTTDPTPLLKLNKSISLSKFVFKTSVQGVLKSKKEDRFKTAVKASAYPLQMLNIDTSKMEKSLIELSEIHKTVSSLKKR